MWNMKYSLPTLVLLLIIVAAFLSRKRLPVRVNSVFAGLLATDFLTMVADFVSTQMDEAGNAFSAGALWLANYLFFALFVMHSFYFFKFTSRLLEVRGSRLVSRASHALYLAEQALLLAGSITGHVFAIRGGAYVAGPAYCLVNVQFGLWIVLSFVLAVATRPPHSVRKAGIYLYLALLFSGVVVRGLFPYVLVMNLFCLFAIQVIYLFYLNPEQYIDGATRLFNRQGWMRVVDEVSSRRGFSMIGFGLRDYAGLQQVRSTQQMSQTLDQLGQWIRSTWPHMPSYYLGRGIFVLEGTEDFDEESALEEVSRRFARPWPSEVGEYYLSVNQMVMAPGVHTASPDVLKGTLRDIYPVLTQPEAVEPVRIDNERLEAYIRKREVHRILMDALANDGLEMFLQPVMDVRTERVAGAEALCRLSDGKGGYVFPDQFIPLAIGNGNLDDLGHQMFRKACAFMSSGDVRDRLPWVNVNVAPEQFKNPNLMGDFLAMLDEYHLEPSRVHLEITEESMIDRSLLHDTMAEFRACGFVFSMDDFGSSYSNLIRLQQNNFSNVKIDRDFTWSYFEKKTPLLPDLILTCHDLDIKVIIEGVETKEMADGMREIGADYIQGFYYSKPIPAAEFRKRYLA